MRAGLARVTNANYKPMPTVYDGLFPNGTFLTAPTSRAKATVTDKTLTPKSAAHICEHMNEDHADAIATYARVYGKLDGVMSARMRELTALGMELDVQTTHGPTTCSVTFDHILNDTDDARDTLIAMAMAQA